MPRRDRGICDAFEEQLDRLRPHLGGRHVGGGQLRMEFLGPVPCGDTDDREFARHGKADALQRPLESGQRGLVYRRHRGYLGMRLQDFLHAGVPRRCGVAAGVLDTGHSELGDGVGETLPGTVSWAVACCQQLGRTVDQRDVLVAEVGQMPDAATDQHGVVDVHPVGRGLWGWRASGSWATCVSAPT